MQMNLNIIKVNYLKSIMVLNSLQMQKNIFLFSVKLTILEQNVKSLLLKFENGTFNNCGGHLSTMCNFMLTGPILRRQENVPNFEHLNPFPQYDYQ